MKDNLYGHAVDHLKFSEQLEAAVLEKASRNRPSFRVTRMISLAAVVCILLASTVFASDILVRQRVRIRNIGNVYTDFTDAQVMKFTPSDRLHGVNIHQMELKPKGYYLFGEGMLYHPSEGFFRVTDDYQLESVVDTKLYLTLKKNGRVYSRELRYVPVDGGIVDEYLGFYPVNSKTVLINLEAEDGHYWPVYLNLETGKCRDLLSGLSEKDFWPESVAEGDAVRITGGQPYQGGVLLQTLVTGMKDGNTDGENLYFWIQKNTAYPIRMEIPDCHLMFIQNDTLYYMDRAGDYYVMDQLESRKIEEMPRSADAMNQGLITQDNIDGTLSVYDLLKGKIYQISGLEPQDGNYDATRNSPDGSIILTHSYPDYTQMEKRLDSLGVLNTQNGLLYQITIDSSHHVQTHGWLDDDRYCVIYEDGLKRFLSIYSS